MDCPADPCDAEVPGRETQVFAKDPKGLCGQAVTLDGGSRESVPELIKQKSAKNLAKAESAIGYAARSLLRKSSEERGSTGI